MGCHIVGSCRCTVLYKRNMYSIGGSFSFCQVPPFSVTTGFPPLPRAVSQLGHASTDSTSKLVSREREVVELEERVHELETRLTSKDEEWRATLAEREEALSAEWERRMKDLRVQLSKVCVLVRRSAGVAVKYGYI